MKIKTQPKNPNSRLPLKRKINKKRLIFIFMSTFVAFFFLCTFIASMLSPSIDVPALNENEDGLTSVSSDDFKGRIDSKLKSIENQEEIGVGEAGASNAEQKQNPEQQKETALDLSDQVDLNADNNQVEQSSEEYDQVPYDSRNSGIVSQEPEQSQKAQSQQNSVQPASKQDNGLILRDKIKVEPKENISMSKVFVGSYSDPAEARRVSQELSGSNLNVTPFIRERNGVYSLQVGSFSNQQKAEGLANELRKRNLAPKVVKE